MLIQSRSAKSRVWQVIAVFHTAESLGEAIRDLAKEGLASRVNVMARRDALAGSQGPGFPDRVVKGVKVQIGPAFRRRFVSLDNTDSGAPVLLSVGPLSRRLSSRAGEKTAPFAESIRSFLPPMHAEGLLEWIAEGALVIWIDASTDEDRQCASRILLRHSRLPVHIHDYLPANAGAGKRGSQSR